MKRILLGLLVVAGLAATAVLAADATTAKPPLGLPPVPIPADNPQTPEKVALGDKLFHDKRFSATKQVACAECHEARKAFTDSPLRTSHGIKKGGQALTGTRNAPTVVNAAYFDTMFWDGRSPSLEDQSQHPFLNPVEMGLKDHQPILKIVRSDPAYVKAFEQVFGKKGPAVTMKETQAIAAFERTQGDLARDVAGLAHARHHHPALAVQDDGQGRRETARRGDSRVAVRPLPRWLTPVEPVQGNGRGLPNSCFS